MLQESVDSLIDAIRRFEAMRFDPKGCRIQAEKFDVKIFENKVRRLIESKEA